MLTHLDLQALKVIILEYRRECMNLIKNFCSFHFYVAILNGSQPYKSFLAIFIIALVLSVLPSFFVFKNILPFVQNLENKALTLVDEVYPQELEVKIKNGQASTNVTEPYYISVRRETLENLFAFKKDDKNTKSKVRILAIDTKGKADEFDRYQSIALLTESSLVYYNDNRINIYSLREIQDLTVNKEFIKSKIKEINKNNSLGNIINFGVLIAPLLIILGFFFLQLISFLMLSLAIYLMVKINQIHTGFKNTFRYTVSIAFLVTLVWYLLRLIPFFPTSVIAISLIPSMAILGFAYSGIYYLKNYGESKHT